MKVRELINGLEDIECYAGNVEIAEELDVYLSMEDNKIHIIKKDDLG